MCVLNMYIVHVYMHLSYREVAIPQQAYNILWEISIKMANKTFVEG